MARIEARTHIEATPSRVFAVLTDWEAQPRWLRDARRVEVRSSHRRGVGVALRRRTAILGVLVDDDLVVTDWHDDRLVAVRHTGRVIRGVGALELTATPHGTQLWWWEEADLPLGPVGEAFATVVVVPWARRALRASLAGLKRVCESASVRP